jgi:hypothetical protein
MYVVEVNGQRQLKVRLSQLTMTKKSQESQECQGRRGAFFCDSDIQSRHLFYD